MLCLRYVLQYLIQNKQFNDTDPFYQPNTKQELNIGNHHGYNRANQIRHAYVLL